MVARCDFQVMVCFCIRALELSYHPQLQVKDAERHSK